MSNIIPPYIFINILQKMTQRYTFILSYVLINTHQRDKDIPLDTIPPRPETEDYSRKPKSPSRLLLPSA